MRKILINPFTKIFPVSYLHILISVLEEHGFSKSKLLEEIPLLASTQNDLEKRVSLQQTKDILEKIISISNMPELGIYYGQRLNFATHGDIGNAIITSKNIQEAIYIVMKYIKTITPIANVTLDKSSDHAVIRASASLVSDQIEAFLVDVFFASTLSIRKFILSNTDYDVRIHLKRPEPENSQQYYDFFGKHVAFSAKNNEYHFPLESLSLTFPLSNPIAREMAELKCQQQLQELAHLDDLISKIKSFMLKTPSYFPDIEEVAQHVHMSTRTLRRKLNDLDSSYQTILDDIRKDLAINYLQNAQLSIIEIAHLLQFNDSSNFSSAFKRWTGTTPSKFRDTL